MLAEVGLLAVHQPGDHARDPYGRPHRRRL